MPQVFVQIPIISMSKMINCCFIKRKIFIWINLKYFKINVGNVCHFLQKKGPISILLIEFDAVIPDLKTSKINSDLF